MLAMYSTSVTTLGVEACDMLLQLKRKSIKFVLKLRPSAHHPYCNLTNINLKKKSNRPLAFSFFSIVL